MEDVVFDENSHKYYLGGEELISVTTLLKKHGLSPNYGDVPPTILAKAAERGTLVHKEIDDYIKFGVMGFTSELDSFIREIKTRGLKILKNEYIVHNNLVAGTVDLLVEDTEGRKILIDFKTTTDVYRESVMWQENLYADLGEEEIDELECWHFGKEGELETLIIPFLDIAEIDRLYACEENGEIYHYQLNGYDEDLMLLANYEEQLADFERHKKQVEDKAKVIRKKILNAMIENNIKSYESDRLKFVVREGGTRRTIDAEKLFKENPKLNRTDYEKISTIQPTLLISIKPVAIEKKD